MRYVFTVIVVAVLVSFILNAKAREDYLLEEEMRLLQEEVDSLGVQGS